MAGGVFRLGAERITGFREGWISDGAEGERQRQKHRWRESKEMGRDRKTEKGREKERENPGLEQDTRVYAGIWAKAPELTASLLTLGPGWAVPEPNQPTMEQVPTLPKSTHPTPIEPPSWPRQPCLFGDWDISAGRRLGRVLLFLTLL